MINTVNVVWRLVPPTGNGVRLVCVGGRARDTAFSLELPLLSSSVLRGKRFYEIHCQTICMSKLLESTLYNLPACKGAASVSAFPCCCAPRWLTDSLWPTDRMELRKNEATLPALHRANLYHCLSMGINYCVGFKRMLSM